MGYTHYYSTAVEKKHNTSQETFEKYVEIINDSYREFLGAIKDPVSGGDLLLVFQNAEEDEETMDRCFHEYGWDDDGRIQLLDHHESGGHFCKTARKIYDLAVVLALNLSASVGYWDGASDSSNGLADIEDYISNELEDFGYDIHLLQSIYEKRYDELSSLNFNEPSTYLDSY